MERLNLGSGPWYADGWVNVDPVIPDPPARPPDVLATVYDLANDPDHRDRYSRVYLGHVLEHVPWFSLGAFWVAVKAVCVPEACVQVVGPCIVRAAKTRQPENIIRAILADPRTPEGGLAHAWTPTEELTVEAVKIGGLIDIQVFDVGLVTRPTWPNPDTSSWQTAVRGVVPGG